MVTEPSADYGVLERSATRDSTSQHAERLRLVGYTVLEGRWPPQDVADFGARLDRVLETQAEEFGGTSRLEQIGEAMTARCPLLYDQTFLELATYAPLLALCRAMLGDYVVLMQQNGVVNPPRERHAQRAYHRDLPYQHFVSSRPLAISALFCIDPFRKETGATEVVLASHRVEAFPSDAVAEGSTVGVDAAPGSFIVFDSMVFHRAGINRSDAPRRAVNQVFSVPIIAQQISLPAALGSRFADRPELRRLLGYDSVPASSVREWRDRRLARARP